MPAEIQMQDIDQTNSMSPMPGVTPYVNVDHAAEASDFYQRAFGAEEMARIPAEDGKRLIHCHLKINGGDFMLSDCFEEMTGKFQESRCFTMHLQVDDVDAAWKRAVDAGAQVTMPLEVQFWGDKYGQLRDPFGVYWSLGGKPN